MSFVKRPLFLGTMGIALLSFLGWGYWGFGVSGDYMAEFGDALRIHQGSVPYREFVPNYGILYAASISGLFYFGHHAVAAIFGATALLVFIQLAGLLRMGILSGRFQQMVYVLLYVGLAAFSLTDSNFMVGFSQSALIAGVLFGFTLLLLNKPITLGRAIALGFLLGLQCFTKLDMAVPSLAILFVILLAVRTPSSRWFLLASYIVTWASVILLLLTNEARWTILVESTVDLLIGAPTIVWDSFLRHRMIVVAIVVGVIFMLASFFHIKQFERKASVLWLSLFPLVGVVDMVRTEHDVRKELVITKWYLYCTVAWICMRVLRMLAQRGRHIFHHERLVQTICVIIVCFFGFSRAFLSGWYPLGYTMPFVLLLLVGSIPHSIETSRRAVYRGIRVAWLGIALLFVGRTAVKYQTASNLATFISPYGPLKVTKECYRKYSTFTDAAHQFGAIRRTLSTFPFFSVILGSSSVNYHSMPFRLQWARPYDVQEMRIIQLIKDGNPELILLENIVSETKPLFGSDYGRKILEYIEAHYEPVVSQGVGFDSKSRLAGGTLYRRKSLTAPPTL